MAIYRTLYGMIIGCVSVNMYPYFGTLIILHYASTTGIYNTKCVTM